MRNGKRKAGGPWVETAMHLYVRVLVGGIADCPWVASTVFAGRVCHWSAYRASGAVVHCNVVSRLFSRSICKYHCVLVYGIQVRLRPLGA